VGAGAWGSAASRLPKAHRLCSSPGEACRKLLLTPNLCFYPPPHPPRASRHSRRDRRPLARRRSVKDAACPLPPQQPQVSPPSSRCCRKRAPVRRRLLVSGLPSPAHHALCLPLTRLAQARRAAAAVVLHLWLPLGARPPRRWRRPPRAGRVGRPARPLQVRARAPHARQRLAGREQESRRAAGAYCSDPASRPAHLERRPAPFSLALTPGGGGGGGACQELHPPKRPHSARLPLRRPHLRNPVGPACRLGPPRAAPLAWRRR
jgi:hypothetical protein